MNKLDAKSFVSTKGCDPFLAQLSSITRLSPASEKLIASLSVTEEYAPGHTIRRPSTASARPFIIRQGWAARYRLVADGRRQIIALLLPGDHAGLSEASIESLDLPVVALTQVKAVNALPLASALNNGRSDEHEGLRRAIAATDAQTAKRLVDQVVRLGRQSAYERTAHLLAELHSRLSVVNLANDHAFQMPLTQESMADVLGLSVVHLNRIMQQLKRDRILSAKFGHIDLFGRDSLYDIGDYYASQEMQF